MPENGPTVNKPTRFLVARDWLHRPGYRFRVAVIRWRLRKVRRG